jgi:hypothetical protein
VRILHVGQKREIARAGLLDLRYAHDVRAAVAFERAAECGGQIA